MFCFGAPRSDAAIAQNLVPPGPPLSLPTRFIGTMDHFLDRRLQSMDLELVLLSFFGKKGSCAGVDGLSERFRPGSHLPDAPLPSFFDDECGMRRERNYYCNE